MRLNGITLDISASGGTSSFEDAVRFIMAGASTIQPCREIMVQGWDLVTKWLEELESWMEKKGYNSVMEMKGIAADKIITDFSELDLPIPQIMGGPEPKYKMAVNDKKCIDCGWCEACCSHLAIKIENGLPDWEPKKCELCGLCEAVCPVKAISMEPR
jgi:ferredoxin